MPRVRYTGDGGRYRAGGHTFEPGDARDVPEGLAEHLVHTVDAFEYADDHVTDVEYAEVEQTKPEEDEKDEESTDGESMDETEEEQAEDETEEEQPGDESEGDAIPDDGEANSVEREASQTLPFNPEAHTNDEIEDRVQDVDDESVLRALLNIEQEQKDRAGATDAIQNRLDDLRPATTPGN